MRRRRREVCKALLYAVLWFASDQAQAQQGTLTLACKGTRTDYSGARDKMLDKAPVSMGVIVNFTVRTVKGFTHPALDYPVEIIEANDVTITFYGFLPPPSPSLSQLSVVGSIDRVTGDLRAAEMLSDLKTHEIKSQSDYELQCKPTQRMF